MSECWTGDGNDAPFFTPYEHLSGEGWEEKGRCAECVDTINSAVQNDRPSDEVLLEILTMQVKRKGAKLSTLVDKRLVEVKENRPW